MDYSFPKESKLKSLKTIDRLFVEGESFTKQPMKLMFIRLENKQPIQITFAVPKRNFKLAVARNRIKRQLRESYRLHKHLLNSLGDENYALLFLYISKSKSSHDEIESSMISLLGKLKDRH
jgi:ribonuclease P protein component